MDENALVLSGGGSRGGYEIGVWQALRELDIPIHIVTGTSVGAINGAMVAQGDFDLAVKLWKELETHMVFDINMENKPTSKLDFEVAGMTPAEVLAYAKEILTKGGAGNSRLEKIIKKYVKEEKIRKSDIKLGIVTVEFPSLKPHYLFTSDIPKGKLSDYILASASCFPAVQTKKIDGTRFMDGSYADVMPVKLALEKGAKNIIAVYLDSAGILRKSSVKIAEEMSSKMITIKSDWNLGNFLIFDTDNTKRIIRLGYLDAMKAFDIFDGGKYTFAKGEFNKRERLEAESAADIFKLDPTIIYKKKPFHRALSKQILSVRSPRTKTIRSLEEVRKKLSGPALVLYIIESLQAKEAKSIFTGRQAFKLLKGEIMAANYIIRNKLLH